MSVAVATQANPTFVFSGTITKIRKITKFDRTRVVTRGMIDGYNEQRFLRAAFLLF
jgi:hypothetical protein